MTPDDIENRKAFCKSLEEPLAIYFPNFRITQFGSSINGLGFKGCDADVCLQTFNNEVGMCRIKKNIFNDFFYVGGKCSSHAKSSMLTNNTLY